MHDPGTRLYILCTMFVQLFYRLFPLVLIMDFTVSHGRKSSPPVLIQCPVYCFFDCFNELSPSLSVCRQLAYYLFAPAKLRMPKNFRVCPFSYRLIYINGRQIVAVRATSMSFNARPRCGRYKFLSPSLSYRLLLVKR